MVKDFDVIDCVTSSVKHSEECTQDDRNRWILASTIFAGKHESGGRGEDREETKSVGTHIFSKICRGAASAAQELLHQDPKFYDFVPPDGEEMDLFGKAIEKIHRYRVKELKIENHTYKFVLAGAIAGIGINKFRVLRNLEDNEDYLLGLLAAEREKENKGLSQEIQKDIVIAGDDTDVSGQLSILDIIQGGQKKKKPPKRNSKNLSYKIGLKIVNPINFYYDPSCEDVKESAWVAERYYLPFHRLEEGFKTGLFKNREELLKILKGGANSMTTTSLGSDNETQKMIYEDKSFKPSSFAPMVEIIEYYGPILERNTGAVLEENQRVIIAGGKVVLTHGPNPDWKRKSPYFFSITSYVPFKGVGAGIADNGIDQELIANELLNLSLEHMAFNVRGVKAVDVSALVDSSQIETGFAPGDIVQVRADSRKVEDLFHDIDYNANANFSAMQMLEKLELIASSSAGVDTQGSNPSSRARISASEIKSNVDKTSRSQFSLARELDETYLEELLVRILDFILQYDLENRPLEEFMAAGIISPSEHDFIASIPTHERLKEAKRRYRLDVRGFRERLERNEYLTRLSEYVQQIIMLCSVDPSISQMIDFKSIIQLFSEAFGLESDKIIKENSPADQANEENDFLKEDRQIEVIPNDDHTAHLPIHYDAILQGAQTEAILNHIRMHITYAQQGGVPFPPPPPELENLIFGPPIEEIGYENEGSGTGSEAQPRATMAGPSTFQ